jgi:hypothetical protein
MTLIEMGVKASGRLIDQPKLHSEAEIVFGPTGSQTKM